MAQQNNIEKNSSVKINKTIILWTINIASFLLAFAGNSVVVAYKGIGTDLHISADTLGWITTINALAAAMFQIPFGKIADIYGRKKIFLYGIIISMVSSLFLGFSNSELMLLILRFIQGFGSALIFATGIAILASIYPPKEKGRILGLNIACVYTGLTLGPSVGGFLITIFTWRSLFFMITPIAFIVLILTLWKIKGEWVNEQKEKFDYAGSTVYALSLLSLMFGFSLLPNPESFIFIALSVVGVLFFIFWENKSKNPVLDLKLFKNNRFFAFSSIVSLFYYASTSSISLILSLYFEYIKGYSAEIVGLILLIQPLMQAVFSPIAGKFSDRIDSRILVTSGVGISLISFTILLFISNAFPIYFIFISLFVTGFGFALFSSPNTNAIMSAVPKGSYGVGSAINGTMRTVGGTFSFGIVTIFMAIIIGNVQITPVYYPSLLVSLRTALIISLILAIIALIISLSRGKKENIV
ncbi:MAG: MFS transporter [Candidatus Lokiarchaeota archaeon]